MRADRQRRLESRGWKVGSAKDFLGLSAQEEALVDLKIELSRQLKQRRTRRRLTQQQAAKLLGSSQSRVAKMESGDPSVSIDLLVRSLLALGGSGKMLARRLARA